MSTVLSTSDSLQRSLSATLTLPERMRLGLQLGSAMCSGGLLTLGLLIRAWAPPEQAVIAELILAAAAVIVFIPGAVIAVRGLIAIDAESQSAQLVSLACLAAMATEQFVLAALIPMVLTLGHFLEERSVMGARAAIDGLRALQTGTARLVRNGSEQSVPVEQLRPGDIVACRPGDTIPIDGEVTSGSSTVNQASITGESTPAEVSPDSTVFSGSINLTGAIQIRVSTVGGDTALGKVLGLLQDAERSKTQVQKLIEQYAAYFVPAVLLIAAVTLFVTRDLSRAITVLVVGCPMPLVIAGPSAMVAALATATRLGILIKNARFLEALADVDTVIFDKTGTVTTGRLEVVGTWAESGVHEATVLRVASTCAVQSSHPVSQAIVRATSEAPPGERAERTVDITESAGLGIRARTTTETILVGRRTWLESAGMTVPPDPDHAGPLVWVACGTATDSADTTTADQASEKVLGCILLSDQPRAEAASVLASLKGLGISRSVLLTGDRRSVAQSISESLGFDEFVAEVLPDQKLVTVEAEKAGGRRPLMVGDGINDALALASADVGIAMGTSGADVAMRSADLVLMNDSLHRIPDAIRLARATRRTIHLSVLVGSCISIVMLALATSGSISPVAGAVLHNLGEVYVLFNSARLLRFS
jgi:Cd2+/Zn2+-exporting ATPase